MTVHPPPHPPPISRSGSGTESINQTINQQSIIQSINQSINQSIKQSTKQSWINQSINQSSYLDHKINQSINQSINQVSRQTINNVISSCQLSSYASIRNKSIALFALPLWQQQTSFHQSNFFEFPFCRAPADVVVRSRWVLAWPVEHWHPDIHVGELSQLKDNTY